ncbi:MAG: pyridoxal 5'-phosphate synthase glutaminase subunit PdxT [Bdellovibrionales bacterium]|nr:pyridoxal 5'-phosphate synthase glutaminase subunit PdxT [Bdellovibrionales bacterium]
MKIGVLSLQGDFDAHASSISRIGGKAIQVRKPSELSALDGIVLPGGESSAMLKLLEPELIAELQSVLLKGMPALATCAGVILLARTVHNPDQASLGVLDIDVQRNGYGRQVDSFIEPSLRITDEGRAALQNAQLMNGRAPEIEAVFIRAPIITRVGSDVDVLAQHDSQPVLLRQGSILAATFHPELARTISPVYMLFSHLVQADDGLIDVDGSLLLR